MAQYSNQPQNVRVNFPKKMNIDSPELRTIEKSTKTIIEILSEYLKKIAEPLQVLKELPTMMGSVQKTVSDNFRDLFISNIETQVLSRQANIKVQETKIGHTRDHMEKKNSHANEMIEKVKSDYKGYFEEIANEHELFLRKLDSHAYEIVENYYPKQIQEKFSFLSIPCINFLSNHTTESAQARSSFITTCVEDAEQSIDTFLEERNMFNDDLNKYHIPNLKEGIFELPVSFIEIENIETGEKELQTFYEWVELGNDDQLEIEKDLDKIVEIGITELERPISRSQEIILKLIEDSNVSGEMAERFKKDCNTIIWEE